MNEGSDRDRFRGSQSIERHILARRILIACGTVLLPISLFLGWAGEWPIAIGFGAFAVGFWAAALVNRHPRESTTRMSAGWFILFSSVSMAAVFYWGFTRRLTPLVASVLVVGVVGTVSTAVRGWARDKQVG